jgi:Uma2 family endonuclease
MPELKKAELVEGVVYVYPVNFEWHSGPDFGLIAWLGYYQWHTPGIGGGSNATVILDDWNEPQPDACMLIRPERGGQGRFTSEGYLVGAPELAAEVSASSARLDLGAKKDVYRRHGVKEYIVWRVLDKAIDWFVLHGGDFERLEPDGSGILKSEVFPGLWLEPAALIRGDGPAVLKVLGHGLASPEHAEFVARLELAGGGKA